MTTLSKPVPPALENSEPDNSSPTNPGQWRNIRFEVLESVEDLPSFNSVVVEFLQLCRKEFYSAQDFEKVICKDQALVARLLKIANCGLFGRSRSVHSIPEAVVLIGLDNLKKIVYAVSSQGIMCSNLMHYDYHPDRGFWIHAMAVGQAAQILSEVCPESGLRPEESFVSGLLHDVGKLVLDKFLGPGPHNSANREVEQMAVGLDHCELAGLILKQWNIPETITGPVRHHHDFQSGEPWKTEAAILSLARGVCREWGVGYEKPHDLSREIHHSRFSAEMEVVGLGESEWDEVVWNLRQSLGKLEEIFSNI
ncbi:MAG: HDOD domain-containing protein [Gemmatimonadales bacterium]|nr:HDOD domain-containing protein [Gemmatimonadales bacterium]